MSLQKKLRPPHYAADKVGQYITRTDESIDRERVDRERAELRGATLAANPDATEDELQAAEEAHPLVRYWDGAHRYDLDAVDYFRGKPVKIREYFNQCEPVIWTLRRLSVEESYQVTGVQLYTARAALACRLGVDACSAIKLTKLGGRLDDASMLALYDADETLPLALGLAVIAYNRPLSEAESFR